MGKQLTSDEILARLQAKVERLGQELQVLESKIEDVRTERQKSLTAIEEVTALVVANEQVTEPNETAIAVGALHKLELNGLDVALEASFDTDLSGLVVYFDGAKNLKERVLRIAKQAYPHNKVLNTSKVTRFLIQAGVTDTDKADNLRPSVHRVFDDQPEVYQKLAAGCWTLIQGNENELTKRYSEVVRYDTEEEQDKALPV